MEQKIKEEFSTRFGGEGILFASAGRINLIGEHTDYNGGFVFPGAIDKIIEASIRPNGTDRVRVYSIDINETANSVSTKKTHPKNNGHAIYSACAAKSSNAASPSKASMPYLPAMCPWAPVCPAQPLLKAALHTP